jgi:hypothetical protein
MFNESTTLERIQQLPQILIDIVYEYMTPMSKRLVRKSNYFAKNPNQVTESFIRDMIRKDCDFVMVAYLEKYSEKWIQMKKYFYKQCIYPNYLYFLHDYCLENQAFKCLSLINARKVSQNTNKKKIIHTRWIQ